MEEVGGSITFFDLDDAGDIERFVQQLKPNSESVSRTGQRLSSTKTAAQVRAERLLEEARKQYPPAEAENPEPKLGLSAKWKATRSPKMRRSYQSAHVDL